MTDQDKPCGCVRQCIANDSGTCVAEECHGPITSLDAKPDTPDQRRRIYDIGVLAFNDFFGEGYIDDLEE